MRRLLNRQALCVLFTVLSPSLAFADTGGDVISNVLSGLIDLLTSTPARLVFVVAIIGIGYGTLALGKIPKQRAIATVIGIGIVFSASYISQKMGLGG
ncbi:MAG: TrbC/VirB2 family protein [Coxiellaceae bacterium]|nr:TrbC/VirB2 family protein [Coxiellaceae bacterium]